MTRKWPSRAAALLLGGVLVAGGSSPAFGSSHREAPQSAADPQIDATDLYAFVSPDKPDSVTLISNWIPFEEPAGGPNFYLWGENVQYDINIDNNADAKPDITYRWAFKTNFKNPDSFLYNNGPVEDIRDENLLIAQTYSVERIAGGKTDKVVTDHPVAPSHVGAASMPDYAKLRNQAVATFGGGGKAFAGQADDPFFLDLRVFDLLYGGNLSETGRDTLDGYNVNSLAVQVPKKELAGGGDANANPIVGVWTTAQRPGMRAQAADGSVKFSGESVQVARLGNPLVNEVVVPVGKKDAFNASKPENDEQFLPKVQDPELPKVIEKVYNMKAPATPRDDLVSVFLTGVEGGNKPANVTPSEQLRLNMSVPPTAQPNRLGFIAGDKGGFPNGRRLTDDVIDISLQVVMGELVGNPNDLGDKVNANDARFSDSFPFVALPHPGSGGGATQVKGTSTSRDTQASGAATAGGGASSAGAPSGGVGAGAGGTAGGLPVLPLVAAGGGLLLALAGFVTTRKRVGA
ncbi:MAG: DUF4331 domain-containing protein [Actinobacteria bacterium]|nr:DUF4331 domain-containing protein [Actinomycetota bacterium]